jgi:hypothetical protein
MIDPGHPNGEGATSRGIRLRVGLFVIGAIGATSLALVTSREPATAALPVTTSTTGASALEGTWKTTPATLAELLAVPNTDRPHVLPLVLHAPKTPELIFHNGAFEGIDGATGQVLATGSYTVTRDRITFVFRRGIAVALGKPYLLGWSIFRGRLTFSPTPGRLTLAAFTVKPWTRVG